MEKDLKSLVFLKVEGREFHFLMSEVEDADCPKVLLLDTVSCCGGLGSLTKSDSPIKGTRCFLWMGGGVHGSMGGCKPKGIGGSDRVVVSCSENVLRGVVLVTTSDSTLSILCPQNLNREMKFSDVR